MIEAATQLAQDPESKVNPDKVEEALVEETRGAGGVAYQFDPNASPQAKAAAAESVGDHCNELHHSNAMDGNQRKWRITNAKIVA